MQLEMFEFIIDMAQPSYYLEVHGPAIGLRRLDYVCKTVFFYFLLFANNFCTKA